MRLLHLEDNALDAELTHRRLAEEWPECAIEWAGTWARYEEKLEQGRYDLILSDFTLADHDGLEALELARHKRPTVPFVFFSGTIGEEKAALCIKRGAWDYVLKDRPLRLMPAIRRAMEAAERERERQLTQEQVLRMQRLENVGMLAAGIAHDFNNVLAPIFLAVPLLRDHVKASPVASLLDTVAKSAERGAGLVRQILGFAQGVTGEPQLVQPKHLLRELIDLLRQTFPSGIGISAILANNLWPVKINPTQLHQVLLNLCINARDAMPDGGALQLRAHNRQIVDPGEGEPGCYVEISVTDSGTGIPPDVLSKIWDPFFTTKPADRGTGLGLPTVRAIIQSYGGAIWVTTTVGQGSTFSFLLPAPVESSVVAANEASTAVPAGRGELVLVVDDDENVRQTTCAILMRYGYRVLAAGSGVEALALYAPRSLEVQLIVTDLGMPQIDGLMLAQIIPRLNPRTRILIVSGFADARARLQAGGYAGALLTKPFSVSQLLDAVQSALAMDTPATKL